MKRQSVWARGKTILFGQMYEDAALERRAFAGHERVFCIASAGCTAIALSEQHAVTAVDINRDQLVYAQGRAAGAEALAGRADRALRRGRQIMRIAGWRPERLARFVACETCAEQMRLWAELDTRFFRAAFDTAVMGAMVALRAASPAGSQLPLSGFGESMRARLGRGLARYANAENPFAGSLFTGALPPPRPALNPIRFEHGEAASFLEECGPDSFDAFTLSNILDGATTPYAERLRAAVRRAAAPEAVVMVRSFRQPESAVEYEAAAEDRAMLWGSIRCRPARLF